MVDIDDVLAAAIRTALLEMEGPGAQSHHHIEIATARRVRTILESEGVIITHARPLPEAGWLSAKRHSLAKHQPSRMSGR